MRTASCSCGQLSVRCDGEPVRISMWSRLAPTISVYGVRRHPWVAHTLALREEYD